LTVNYTVAGTALLGTDYTGIAASPATKTVSFAAGSATATVTVDPTPDVEVEANETVALTLATGPGYAVQTTTAVTGTIQNDDLIKASINDIVVVEGKDTNAVFSVILSSPSSQPISLGYTTAPINATSDVDYKSMQGSIIIPANTTVANILIPVLDGNDSESDEAFTVTISSQGPDSVSLEDPIGQAIITDTLQSAITRTLPVNVENLKLIGTASINGTGNARDNIITGNSGDNILTGAGGNDQYCFNVMALQGMDRIEELVAGGIDTLDFTGTALPVRINLGNTSVQNVVPGHLKLTLSSDGVIENVVGGGGPDRIVGNTLNNSLAGVAGNDQLLGGNGDDVLNGGLGDDILTGGTGNDNFVFGNPASWNAAIGTDVIVDFTSDNDRITLLRSTFTTLQSQAGPGFSLPGEFAIVSDDDLAPTNSALIVYSTGSGGLFYNQNGNQAGLGSGGEFAVLLNTPSLTATSFVVV
ncbi:MAG: Calx-beta domain-containing protein, partial [Cyanobacteriota bacterium]